MTRYYIEPEEPSENPLPKLAAVFNEIVKLEGSLYPSQADINRWNWLLAEAIGGPGHIEMKRKGHINDGNVEVLPLSCAGQLAMLIVGGIITPADSMLALIAFEVRSLHERML